MPTNSILSQLMVTRDLRSRGLNDERVLSAMLEVPRDEFVSDDLRCLAYSDQPLPIGFGQTISQPYTVAYMAEQARLRRTEHVLEIGTGSGYGAAVLSRLAKDVHTIERLPQLAEAAEQRLRRLHYDTVVVHCGDGSLGLPEFAPFDAIVATAAATEVPTPLLDQLVLGGRLVIPVGPARGQRLLRYTKTTDGMTIEDLGSFVFVPLIGGLGARPVNRVAQLA